MKTIGIVAEFNPFHQGHSYFIQQSKIETQADSCLVAMSGDFVQRGEPACLDKYVRTQMALAEGADLVLELPTIFATASAEYFAGAAVHLLASTGLVDTLCFGTQYPDFPYEAIGSFLNDSPKEYNDLLRSELAKGASYPAARSAAIMSCLSSHLPDISFREDMLLEPNTILGIEYAKAALAHGLKISPIKRMGNGYHDSSLEGKYLSASAIRSQLLSDSKPAAKGLCQSSLDLLDSYSAEKEFLGADNLSDLLYQALLQGEGLGYTDYFDCDQDLSNRIQKHLKEYQSFTQFAGLLKTKNYTYSRISRVLLHIVLGIYSSDVKGTDTAKYKDTYFRILGFHKAASSLLTQMKEEGSLPILSKMADAKGLLSPEAYAILQKDIYAASIYEQLAFTSGSKRNEMTQSPIIL